MSGSSEAWCAVIVIVIIIIILCCCFACNGGAWGCCETKRRCKRRSNKKCRCKTDKKKKSEACSKPCNKPKSVKTCKKQKSSKPPCPPCPPKSCEEPCTNPSNPCSNPCVDPCEPKSCVSPSPCRPRPCPESLICVSNTLTTAIAFQFLNAQQVAITSLVPVAASTNTQVQTPKCAAYIVFQTTGIVIGTYPLGARSFQVIPGTLIGSVGQVTQSQANLCALVQ